VMIDGTWYEFSWPGPAPATGCSPADPAGDLCTPSGGGNSVFADAPPWTFTCTSPAGCWIKVQDAFNPENQFDLFDFGGLILTTSPFTFPAPGCGNDPEICMMDPNFSTGMVLVAAGAHSLTINQFPTSTTGAAYFQIIQHQPVSAVGGDLIPLDSTMVLVAGAQYTAAWMIPVIVSAAGFGLVLQLQKTKLKHNSCPSCKLESDDIFELGDKTVGKCDNPKCRVSLFFIK